MLEIIVYTLAGIILYLASDQIVLVIEKKLGKRLQYRSLLFFAIISVLALIAFNTISQYFTPQGAQHSQAKQPYQAAE